MADHPSPDPEGAALPFPARAAPRAALSLTVSLRVRGRTAMDVRLHDLSTHGFAAESVHPLAPGTMLWVTLPGLAALQARVRWFRDHDVGCVFEQPLHSSVFDWIVATARASRAAAGGPDADTQ